MKSKYNVISEETQKKYRKFYNMKVLRQKRDDKPLNVSYTTEGLKWTQNKTGRFIYFKQNVKPVFNHDKGILILKGKDTRISPYLYVENYVPKNHENNPYLQKCEVQWLDKANKMNSFFS